MFGMGTGVASSELTPGKTFEARACADLKCADSFVRLGFRLNELDLATIPARRELSLAAARHQNIGGQASRPISTG